MRRSILVVFLILGLCQGIWLEPRDLPSRLAAPEPVAFRDITTTGPVLSPPRPVVQFARLLPTVEAGQGQPRSLRLEGATHPVVVLPPIVRGHKRHCDIPINPREWGLIGQRFPRSDG